MVCDAVMEFFQNGKLLKQMNATNMVLLPKVSNPQKESEFHLIS